MAEIQTGISKSASRKLTDPVEVPYLRVANVQDGHLDLSVIKHISIERKNLERYTLQKGDVLLTEGGDFDKLGRGTVWNNEIESCVHQNHVFSVRTDATVLLPKFLSILTASSYGKRYFISCSKQSTNLASINSTQLKQFPVLLPSLDVQKSIVSALNLWDNAIEKTEALIEAKERQFKAILQLLMVPKTYWESCKFKDILVERIERQGKSDFVISSVGINGLRNRDEIYSKELAKDYIDNKVVRKNDIAFGLASDSIVYGINTQTMVCSVSPAYKVFNIVHCNVDFLGYYLKAANRRLSQKYLIISARQGKSIDFKGFLNQAFFFPSCKEQKEIVGILNLANKEIALLKKVLEQYRIQKRGLMQKLLTGEWKVSSFQAAADEIRKEVSA